MERDANRPKRDDHVANAPATDQERKAQTPTAGHSEEAKEAAAERAAERERAEALSHCKVVFTSVSKVFGELPELEEDNALSPAERQAVRLLYQARTATNEIGNYAAAMERKQYLNQALATLQPVLAHALDPKAMDVLEAPFRQVQTKIGDLKHEIKHRLIVEAHKGRLPAAKKSQEAGAGGDDDGRSALGSIAWELAQLVKKRKRVKIPYDASANPIVDVLEAMQTEALELGKLCIEITKLDERRAKAGEGPDRDAPETARDQAVNSLSHRLAAFLETCREGQDDPKLPGHYEVLAERFAGLVARISDLDRPAVAVSVAADTVAEIYACVDDADALVTAADDGAAPTKKRGVLGSLFGRKKS